MRDEGLRKKWASSSLADGLWKKQSMNESSRLFAVGCVMLSPLFCILIKSSAKMMGPYSFGAGCLCWWGWYCPQEHWKHVGWFNLSQWLLGVGHGHCWLGDQQDHANWCDVSCTRLLAPIRDTALVWVDCFGNLKDVWSFVLGLILRAGA